MRFLEIIYNFLETVKNLVLKILDKTFEVKSAKNMKIGGMVTAVIIFACTLIFANQFTKLDFEAKWLLLSLALIAPMVIGFSIAYSIRIKNSLANKIYHFAVLLLMPFLSMLMTECLNGNYLFSMRFLGIVANYVVALMFYCIVFALSGSFRISYLTSNTIFFGFALAHSYIMEFRGTPFLPFDFLSISTAVGVANTYDFTPTYKIILASYLFIFLTIFAVKTKTPEFNITSKIISRVLTGTFTIVLSILFFGTTVLTNLGIKPDFWKQERGYERYGFLYNFFCNTKYLWLEKPENYNHRDVEQIVDKNKEQEENEIIVTENAPNIICIMNESLADLRVLGEFQTNEDYMPFMRSLTENTIKGNTYVPVIGAGTSNTEFEFLTGHSTAFLPSGSNAYMLYIKKPIASLVSTVESQGYNSFAIHPYYAAGWRRTDVYSNLGFNKFVSLENIIDTSIMGLYQENANDPDYLQQLIDQYYPGSNMLLRQYISDSYNYKLLIDDFENRDTSVPYFAFNVTMQNHGGYTTSALNFNESIYTTSLSKSYNKVNKYLSLVKASDDAFRELIGYFSTVEEPTIICMFGDHHPSVETGFVAEVLGVDNLANLTAEQEQLRHATPFFIWANYDIEEQYIDKLSVNYLSSLVLETAGVRLTNYNKYLLKLAKTLPVIDTVGYVDNNGAYYTWNDESPYKSLLEDYEKVQYNNIFDQENVNRNTFYLDGYVPEATPIEEES